MSEFAPVLVVSALNGTNGFRLDGDAPSDESGRVTAGGGDVNGDGLADLLIGAPLSNTGGPNRGLVWVVFGAASAVAAQGLAAVVAGGGAYRFQGEAADDQAGFSVRSAGDVDGDGLDDILIGAVDAKPDNIVGQGASYLVFGGTTHFEALDVADGLNDNRINLASLTAAHGYRFDGAYNAGGSGYSGTGAGDMNGDGFADLVLGGPGSGIGHIVFGGTANLAALDAEDASADGRVNLTQISAGQGLKFYSGSSIGASVSGAGDVNGDGFADAIVSRHATGQSYLIFGRPAASFTSSGLNLAALTGLEGTVLNGIAADNSGRSVTGAGDINGDGFDDVAIGAFYADAASYNSGSAYVVFGHSAWGPSTNLATLDGSNGFRLNGLRPSDHTGFSLTGTGDVNGDGFADLLVSAYNFDRIGAVDVGAAYVIFGKAAGFAAVINLGALNGDSGFRIEGEGPALGEGLARGAAGPAGDVNGDGFDDIVVGAQGADNNALTDSGSSYIIYGHRADTAVTRTGTALANRINGGRDDDTISGLSGADTLIGWEGDDTINGGGGADRIEGGEGSDRLFGGSLRDVFVVSAGEDRIDGGSEMDLFDGFAMGAVSLVVNLSTGQFFHPNGEEIQTLTGVENVRGSSGADTLTGNLAANALIGLAGNDTLGGGGSNDALEGNSGKDTMTGGVGIDRFVFRLTADSSTLAATRDVITDFVVNPAAGTAFVDRIDLSVMDAQAATGGNQAFVFIGTAAFTAEGQARAVQSGADTIVELNTAGLSAAESTIQLSAFTATTLSAADFVL